MIDWSEAPAGYNWHGFDANCSGWWHTSKPVSGSHEWRARSHEDMDLRSPYNAMYVMKAMDITRPDWWKESLEQRPQVVLAPETVEAIKNTEVSDGSTARYYELPDGATQLQHLISAKNMNAQIGEIFRACYRYGEVHHSPQIRDIKKIIFYAQAELERLEKLENAKAS